MMRALRDLAPDCRAAVTPMVAALIASLLLAAGLALDVGLYRLGNRDLRAATEAAALAAAMNPAQAEARARDYLARNGYDPSVLKQVTLGRYCADVHAAPEQRFDPGFTRCPGTGAANAVRIRTQAPGRRFLTGALGAGVLVPDLAATATATRIDEAGIGLTSGLLTVTNALVNSVNDLLGALIGVRLRLGTADVEALMGGNVDAGLFFDSLAQRTGHGGTYGELVQGSFGLQDLALSAAEASSSGSTASALRAFGTQAGNGYRVPLKDLFALGVWQDMPVGEADAQPALRAGMNAYQLMSYAVQSGPTAVDLSQAIGALVPASTVRISLVARNAPARPRFAFGPAGETQAFTAALRLKVDVDLPVTVPLVASARVRLPILLDVAAAKAELTAIDCADTAEQSRDTIVRVRANSSEINAFIGEIALDPIANPAVEVRAGDIQQATIARISLLGIIDAVDVRGRAIVQPVSGASNATLAFGPGVGGPGAPGAPQTVGNRVALGDTLGGLASSLLGSQGLEVRLVGLCLPIVCSSGLVNTLVRDVVLPATVRPVTQLLGNVIDPFLNNVLATLGIQLGHATVWVTGARCGVAVLA